MIIIHHLHSYLSFQSYNQLNKQSQITAESIIRTDTNYRNRQNPPAAT
jgi:hypothetical protein